jgi:nucleotide-binding universal stress UspA family protein
MKERLMFDKILVALDGSSLAQAVLPYAEELAWKFESQVLLLSVVTPVRDLLMTEFMPHFQDADREALMERANAYLSGVRGELRAKNIAAEIMVVEGDPPTMILDVARREGADLIAMTTHGRTGLGLWAFGSVADKVMRHAPCPVLLVRSPAA